MAGDGTIIVSADPGLTLTPREIAIAQGRDPDEIENRETGGSAEAGAGGVESGEEGKDAAKEGNDGRDAAKDGASPDPSAPDWKDEEIKALAGEYGLSDDALGALGGVGDFLKAAREAASGKTPEKKEQPPAEADKAAGETKAGETKAGETKAEQDPLDPDYLAKEGYDDITVAVAKRLKEERGERQKLADELRQRNEREMQERERMAMLEFHREVDKFGGRFGETGKKLNDEQLEARRKLLGGVFQVVQSLAESGKELPELPAVLKRARLLEFEDDVRVELESAVSAKKEDFAKKVKEQSAKRRPVGRATTKPTGKRELPGEAEDPIAAIANSPEMIKFWNENSTE